MIATVSDFDTLRLAIDAGMSPLPVCGVVPVYAPGGTIHACACPWHNEDGKACHSPGKVPLLKWGELTRPATWKDCLYWIDEYTEAGVEAINWAFHLGFSRMAVIDVDPRNGGPANWRDVAARYGLPPVTPRDSVEGRGFHLWFRAPADGVLPEETKIDLAPGVELKHGKTYVIGPPSMHRTGKPYAWEIAPQKIVR